MRLGIIVRISANLNLYSESKTPKFYKKIKYQIENFERLILDRMTLDKSIIIIFICSSAC